MSDPHESMNSPARPVQFSLRTLFVLVGLIAVGATLLVSYRQFHEARVLREENARLRGEVGELKVEEGTEYKLQAIAMPTSEDMVWKWRVHVPNRQNIFLSVHAGVIDNAGFPGSPGGHAIDPGEHVITVSYRQDHTGVWQWFVVIEPDPRTRGTISLSNPVPDSLAKVIAGSHSTATSGVGSTVTLAEPGKPLELFRFRIFPQAQSSPSGKDAGEGILMWIYEGMPGQ
jgi:hypothetical protein